MASKLEEAKANLQDAHAQQVLRGRQLLVAALAFCAGEMPEDELMGFVIRYGSAADERKHFLSTVNDLNAVSFAQE